MKRLAIRDQRVMVGAAVHQTPDDVEAAWTAWVERNGLPARRSRGDRSTDLRETGLTLTAYVSAGNWTADCAVCSGGVPGWPPDDLCDGNPRGCCLDCGSLYALEYPDPDELEDAVDALLVRPIESRNWRPDRGETAVDLKTENEERGFPATPLRLEELRGRIAADVVDRHGDDGRAFLAAHGISVP